MDQITIQEKLKILEKLPLDLQNMFSAESTGEVLLSLEVQHDLHGDRASKLVKLAGDVILGLLPLADLSREIGSRIGLDSQSASNLAQDLNAELFLPVMLSLRQAPEIAKAVLGKKILPPLENKFIVTKHEARFPESEKSGSDSQVSSPKFQVSSPPPGEDNYREPVEAAVGPLKPRIGPEPKIMPKPVVPPSVVSEPQEEAAFRTAAPAPTPLRPLISVPIPPQPSNPPVPIRVPTAPAPPSIQKPISPLTFTKPVTPPAPPQLPTEEMAHPAVKSEARSMKYESQTKQFTAPPESLPIPDLEETTEEMPNDVIDLRQNSSKS